MKRTMQRMSDDPSLPHCPRRLSKAQLLVWPASARNRATIGKGGFCIGWKDDSSNEWPMDTVIVVSILSLPSVSLLEALRRRLQRLGSNCCKCCTCPPTQSITKRSVCIGCTQRICFEKLDVVAYLNFDETFDNLSHIAQNIPFLCLTTPHNLPYWSWAAKQQNCSTQIVLYNDSTTTPSSYDILYAHESSQPNISYFSDTLLTRITHIPLVLRALSSMDDSTITKTMSLQQQQPPQNAFYSNPSNGRNENETQNQLWYRILSGIFITFMSKYSLFWGHCTGRTITSDPSIIPVYSIYLIWVQSKRECTIGNVCSKCKKVQHRHESRYISFDLSIQQWNILVSAIIDTGMGVLFAHWLFYHCCGSSNPSGSIHLNNKWLIQWLHWQYQYLSLGLQWMERYPIGFKLNENLTEQLGREIQRFWDLHKQFLTYLIVDGSDIVQPVLIGGTILVCLVMGVSGLLVLLYDCARILTLHIALITYCTHCVYTYELSLLAALWRLFRGKKKNILRHRTDTMEYDSMQLLLGTILFTIALFLFTTIFAYHAFFTMLYFATTIPALMFIVPCTMLRSFPLGEIIQRWRRPRMFTKECYLVDDTVKLENEYGMVSMTRLATRSIGYSQIVLQKIAPILQSVLVWMLSMLAGSLSGRGWDDLNILWLSKE